MDLREQLGKPMKPGLRNDPRILVDPADEWLLEYKWTIWTPPTARTQYATRKRCRIHLHRLLMGFPIGYEVDHINGNGLDNRRCNLRLASKSQNAANQRQKISNKSGFKGIARVLRCSTYKAFIRHNGGRYYLGSFPTAEEAARAYDRAAVEAFGEFALTNEMLGLYAKEGI